VEAPPVPGRPDQERGVTQATGWRRRDAGQRLSVRVDSELLRKGWAKWGDVPTILTSGARRPTSPTWYRPCPSLVPALDDAMNVELTSCLQGDLRGPGLRQHGRPHRQGQEGLSSLGPVRQHHAVAAVRASRRRGCPS